MSGTQLFGAQELGCFYHLSCVTCIATKYAEVPTRQWPLTGNLSGLLAFQCLVYVLWLK